VKSIGGRFSVPIFSTCEDASACSESGEPERDSRTQHHPYSIAPCKSDVPVCSVRHTVASHSNENNIDQEYHGCKESSETSDACGEDGWEPGSAI